MGNDDNNYQKKYILNVDDDLMDDINNEIKVKNNEKDTKRFDQKFNKLIKRKLYGNKIKKSNFNQKFNKNGKGIKNVSDLLNLIYDANTDNQFIKRTNRTIQETIFDIRNNGEDDDAINKSNIIYKNKINKNPVNEKLKQKLGKLMRGLVEPNKMNNNNNLQQQYNIYDKNNENNNLEPHYNIYDNNYNNLKQQNIIYDNKNKIIKKQYNINNDSNYRILNRHQNNINERVNRGQQPFSIGSENNFSVKKVNEYGSNLNNNLYNSNLDMMNLSNISAINKDMRVTKVSKIIDINDENSEYDQNNFNNDLNSNYQKNNYMNNYKQNSQINQSDYNQNINNNINNNYNKYLNGYNRENQIIINDNKYINNNEPKDNEPNKNNCNIRTYDYNLYKNQNDKIIGKINSNYNNINNKNYSNNNYNEIQNKYINNNINNMSPQNKVSKKFPTVNVIKINNNDNENDNYNDIQSFVNNYNNDGNNNINKDLVNRNLEIQTDLNDLNNISNIPYNSHINNYDYEKSFEKEKKDSFQFLGENDMSHNIDKSDFNNNEINKEISLDYSYISRDEPKEEEYKKTYENSFSIGKTERVNKKKVKTDKSPNVNRKTKSKVKTKKKDTSVDKKKPKYNYKIDLKELIKEDAIEKSLLTPSKRYQNQVNENKKKTKKETVKYNQPFKFNLYEDF